MLPRPALCVDVLSSYWQLFMLLLVHSCWWSFGSPTATIMLTIRILFNLWGSLNGTVHPFTFWRFCCFCHVIYSLIPVLIHQVWSFVQFAVRLFWITIRRYVAICVSHRFMCPVIPLCLMVCMLIWFRSLLLIHGSVLCCKLVPVTVSDDHHTAQLSCACLNARSVLPKHFDIFAFICAFHILTSLLLMKHF